MKVRPGKPSRQNSPQVWAKATPLAPPFEAQSSLARKLGRAFGDRRMQSVAAPGRIDEIGAVPESELVAGSPAAKFAFILTYIASSR